MADTTNIEDTTEKTRSKLPLLIGLLLSLFGAGAGFFVVYSGILGDMNATQLAAGKTEKDLGLPTVDRDIKVSFIPIDPLIISLDQATGMNLRFRAQLEVKESEESDVAHLMPRVVDVLNGYLRALDVSDLQDRSVLTRLRAQMLRRVQVVTGGGHVRDLLIMEFVLN